MAFNLHTLLPLIGVIPYLALKVRKKQKIFFLSERRACIIGIFAIGLTAIDILYHKFENYNHLSLQGMVAGEGFEPPT